MPAGAARAALAATDERVLIALLGSVLNVAAVAIARFWRG